MFSPIQYTLGSVAVALAGLAVAALANAALVAADTFGAWVILGPFFAAVLVGLWFLMRL